MELSERYIQKFEDEGYLSVYEGQDPAGTIYDKHVHKGKVSLFVTDGSITLDFSGTKKEVVAPSRFDIPKNTYFSAVVGNNGWIVIVAEEREGDSQISL